ncbi:hypothetical protein CO614_04455 [Lysobacteraceae bacterium NML120232]|nr:hypothetical protein CO608_03810 [Xanthomonadaceae bacterium NML08-0793]PJK12534.1 hypothetical protein CO614_04455 [Xanthomonadaceae bacterium NML120232]
MLRDGRNGRNRPLFRQWFTKNKPAIACDVSAGSGLTERQTTSAPAARRGVAALENFSIGLRLRGLCPR